MNVKNMRRLRWRLQRKTDLIQFRMNHWWINAQLDSIYNKDYTIIAYDFIKKHPCQTAACIGGYAVIIAIESGDIEEVSIDDIYLAARTWLGLDYADSYKLFMGR